MVSSESLYVLSDSVHNMKTRTHTHNSEMQWLLLWEKNEIFKLKNREFSAKRAQHKYEKF